MKYLCLIYETDWWHEMPKAELDAMLTEYRALGESLHANGQYVAGQALQPSSTATLVRVREGKTLTTDGPFAETKEQLSGFYLVEAKDLNEAIQIAARIPSARHGAIEVRPIKVFG